MSTTMLETFDTQMLDYQNDADFSMHFSSSDSWFQDEAAMEDDGRTGHLEHPDTAIEVDMEPYDETNNPEYEMDDGSQSLDPDTAEIVDVEVYDASRAHSPEAVHDHETPALPVSNPTDLLPIPAEFSEPSPSHLTPPTRSEERPDTFTPDTHYRSGSPPHLHALTALVEPNEGFHADTGDEQFSPSHTQESKGGHRGVADDKISAEAEEPIAGGEPDANEQRLDVPLDADQGASVEATESHDIASFAEVSGGTFEDQSYQQGAEGADFDPSTASTGDPHEISDGVYIDPPPPVLISLPADSSPPISLFNAPSKSRTGSPSDDECNIPDLVVLLGHLPTLYYEPLSSVFEALRGDEYLRRMPDLLHGELLLDAYDLELVMSEDYTFAHELSLHDINVLHDGLNKPGPLRLQLRTVTPRFIDRYHVLQEQIAQFQITDSSIPIVGHSGEEPNEQDTGGDIKSQLVPKQHAEDQDGQQAEHSEDDQHYEGGKATTEDRVPTEAAVEDEQDEAHSQHGAQEDYTGSEYLLASKDVDNRSHEESTVPRVETDHTHQVSNLNVSEADSGEPEEYDEQDEEHHSQHGYEQHDEPDDENTAHPEMQQGEEDPQPGTEDFSDIPVTESEAVDERVITPLFSQTASNLTTFNTPFTRNQHLQRDDVQHSDLAELQEASEQPGPIPTNLDAELDLTTNVDGEPEQAGSSADATLADPAPDVIVAGDASYELDAWDDTLDGEGDPDTNWDLEDHEHETASNLSSVTLSSKTSTKRSLSEAELEEYEDEGLPPRSPDPKRPRVE